MRRDDLDEELSGLRSRETTYLVKVASLTEDVRRAEDELREAKRELNRVQLRIIRVLELLTDHGEAEAR